jgi:hypothetical protein
MATLLTATQKLKLRSDGHRSKFYLSVSQPRTLLTGLVNNGSIERGAVSIDFDGGSAADTSLIQAGQTLTVTLADGKKYSTTVVSFSGTASSGTITVDANPIAWEDDAALVIYENWEPRTIPPTFDNGTGISKKRGQVWSDQTLPAGIPPVCRMGCHRPAFLPVPTETTAGATITNGADDGYIAGSLIHSGTSLVVMGKSFSGIVYNAWLRFGPPIPQGSTIVSAYLEFTAVNSPVSKTVSALIRAEAADNPAAPTTAADYNGRTRTSASVNWSINGGWTDGDVEQSPDISAVIQEIVDRPGFAEGNAIQFFIEDNGSANNNYVYARDYSIYPTGAAALHVTYLPPVSVDFDIDLTNSKAMAPGASISSYALSVAPATGAAVSFNTATGVGTVTVSQAGQYWLEGSCTDNNGNTHTGHRRVWAHDPDPDSANYPYVDFSVASVSTAWDGSATAEFEVFGVADFDQFQDGALVVLWKQDWYGDEAGAVGLGGAGDDILFAGYMLGDTIQQDWNNGTVSFRAGNVIETLKQLPMQALSIHAESNPAYWFQYDHRMTIARALHWLWYWHSTLFEVADVFLPSNTLYKKLFKFNEGSLFSQGQDLASTIFANVTANRAGQVYVEQNIQTLDAAGRAAVSELTEITSRDWRERLTLPRRHKKAQAGVKLRGYHFDGQTLTPYCSIAPSKIRDDTGSGVAPYDGIVVDGQAMANMYSGRLQAIANNDEVEERLKMAGNYSVIDVVPQYWLTQDIAPGDTPRGLTWTDKRLVPRQVTHNIDVANGLLTTDIVCEPEAIGPDGIADLCPEVPDAVLENPPWPGTEPALGALVAFSSVNFRDDNASDWTEQSAGGADYGAKDVWWTLRRGSTNPQDAILWKVDGGEIYRSLDCGLTWADVTPAESPPDTWEGSTAPSIELSTFVGIFSDSWNRGRFFALETQEIDGLWQGWLAVTDNDGGAWQRVELYDGATLPAGIRPIWLACNGSYILVTVWVDAETDILRLLVFDAETMDFVDEFDLGAATEAELNARTYIAYPRTVLDDDDLWYIFGRMNAPQGLANPEHIIKTANAGTAWASVANGFTTKHVAGLNVSLLDGADRVFKVLVQTAVDAPPELAPGTKTELQDDVSTERWLTYVVPIDSTSAYVFIVGDSAPTRRVYTIGSGFGAPTELTNATAVPRSVTAAYPPSSNQVPAGKSFVGWWFNGLGADYSLINLPPASTVQILHDAMSTDVATMLGSNRIALYEGRNIAVIENYAAASPVDAKADYTDVLPSGSAVFAHSNLTDQAVGVSVSGSDLIAWLVTYDGSFVPTLIDQETLSNASCLSFIKISDTEYWVFYTDVSADVNPDNHTLYMAELTVSGSTLSWGSPVTIYTLSNPGSGIARTIIMINPLSSTRALFYYMEYDYVAFVWSVKVQTIEYGVGLDGNDVTLDSQENSYDNCSADPYGWSLFKISDTVALASWYSDDAERIFREVDIS